ILKIGEGVMPVARHCDLFARQTAAVLQPAFTDHRLQAGFAEVGTEGKIILPRADQNHIPLAIDHAKLSRKLSDILTARARLHGSNVYYFRNIFLYSAIFWEKAPLSISIISIS